MRFIYARRVEDEKNRILYESSAMIVRRNADAEAAMQYLVWALEDIEKVGNRKAAVHARIALRALREANRSDDKTDERA